MKVLNIKTAFVEEALEFAGLPYEKGRPKETTLKALANASQRSHGKFLRQMMISFVADAPTYWWIEFDTYKVGTTRMSTSTMHTLMKGVAPHDFEPAIAMATVNLINDLVSEGDLLAVKASLPASFIYTSFVTMNYEVLRNIYRDRLTHKLPQWKEFIYSFKDIPYYEDFIIGNASHNSSV